MSQLDIRIGTLVNRGQDSPAYIREILPYGFESFSLTFWQTLGKTNLKKLAKEVNAELEGSDAVISSLGVFGNPLMDDAAAKSCREGWKKLIDAAPLFGCDVICGFAGRIVDKPIDASMDRYAKVFKPLAKRAADKGVKIAFENCDMGGTWKQGGCNIAQYPAAWDMMFKARNIGSWPGT